MSRRDAPGTPIRPTRRRAPRGEDWLPLDILLELRRLQLAAVDHPTSAPSAHSRGGAGGRQARAPGPRTDGRRRSSLTAPWGLAEDPCAGGQSGRRNTPRPRRTDLDWRPPRISRRWRRLRPPKGGRRFMDHSRPHFVGPHLLRRRWRRGDRCADCATAAARAPGTPLVPALARPVPPDAL